MAKAMPTPDAALKDFFKDNRIFAALFNGYLFQGNEVIHPHELLPAEQAYTETAVTKGKIKKIDRYRDNVRRTSQGYLVILGIEDQDQVHYSMPVRKLLYDALGYCSELTAAGHTQDRTEWTTPERLSNVAKGTMVTPIITVVFYTGEKVWDGPTSLYEMMEIKEQLKPFVPDYPLFVIDMGHDRTLHFPDEALEGLRVALSDIYNSTGETDETKIQNHILALAGILANDTTLYRQARKKGGTQKMCEALRRRDEAMRQQVEAKMGMIIAQKDASLAEKDAIIAEQSQTCEALRKKDEKIRQQVEAEMGVIIAEKDAIIAEQSQTCEVLRKKDEERTQQVRAEMEQKEAEIRKLQEQLLAYQKQK